MNLVEDHSLLGPWPKATLDKRRKDHEQKYVLVSRGIETFYLSMMG